MYQIAVSVYTASILHISNPTSSSCGRSDRCPLDRFPDIEQGCDDLDYPDIRHSDGHRPCWSRRLRSQPNPCSALCAVLALMLPIVGWQTFLIEFALPRATDTQSAANQSDRGRHCSVRRHDPCRRHGRLRLAGGAARPLSRRAG